MKNTTRHKIVLNPARGSPSGARGKAREALALFMFLEGKMQHLINIPAPNLLKLTSRKRDIHERKCEVGDDDIDTILYNIMTLILRIQIFY